MRATHPIDSLQWVDRNLLRSNDYNPNTQVQANHELLIESIRADGWTQPIVVRPPDENGLYTIVDGEHRWLASAAFESPMVPVVVLNQDTAGCIAATVRHNRARGNHGVDGMLQVIKRLRAEGQDSETIEAMLGIPATERERIEINEEVFLALMAGKDLSMDA